MCALHKSGALSGSFLLHFNKFFVIALLIFANYWLPSSSILGTRVDQTYKKHGFMLERTPIEIR